VAGEATWSAIRVNDHATCGVAITGAAFCWGQNTAGELGTGSFAFSQPNPTAVAGGLVITTE
jgi:hypothetical protein